MKWLAVDCATDTAVVAIGQATCLDSKQQVGVRTHSKMLLQIINQLLIDQQWHPQDLDAIIFGRGPGSFTGLRVACSVVQGLAYAHDLAVYPVSDLQSIAHHLRLNGETRPIISAIDARMNELYWSYYPTTTDDLAEERVSAAENMIVSGEDIVLAGVGLDNYLSSLNKKSQASIATVLAVQPDLQAMVDLVKTNKIEPVAAEKALPVYIRNQVTQGASDG